MGPSSPLLRRSEGQDKGEIGFLKWRFENYIVYFFLKPPIQDGHRWNVATVLKWLDFDFHDVWLCRFYARSLDIVDTHPIAHPISGWGVLLHWSQTWKRGTPGNCGEMCSLKLAKCDRVGHIVTALFLHKQQPLAFLMKMCPVKQKLAVYVHSYHTSTELQLFG